MTERGRLIAAYMVGVGLGVGLGWMWRELRCDCAETDPAAVQGSTNA